MRALAFAAAFALIGSAAGAQTVNTKETVVTPTSTTTTTTRTHTKPDGCMMATKHHMNKRHMKRHCMKMKNGHKMRSCKAMMGKKGMMGKKKMDAMPNMKM